MNIKSTIETYNANYAVAIQTLQAQAGEARQRFLDEMASHDYTTEGLAKRYQSRIKKAMADYEETAAELNARVRKTAAEAQAEVERMIEKQTGNRPADYSSRAALTLQFISIAGPDITDDTAHELLRDFQYDAPMMRQFRALIGKQTGKSMVNMYGNEVFSKTFRGLTMIDKMTAKAAELQETAAKMYVTPLQQTDVNYYAVGLSTSIPTTGYAQRMYEVNAVNDAGTLDAMVAEFTASVGE